MKSEIIAIVIISAVTSLSLFAHSKPLKPGFADILLKHYFDLQASLAKDDLEAAKQHSNSLKTTLGQGPSFDEA